MILPLIVLDNTPHQAKDENHAFSVADLKMWEQRYGKVPAPLPRAFGNVISDAVNHRISAVIQLIHGIEQRADVVQGLVGARGSFVALRKARLSSSHGRRCVTVSASRLAHLLFYHDPIAP